MPGKVLQRCLHILSSWCWQERNRIGIQTHDSWNKVQKHDILKEISQRENCKSENHKRNPTRMQSVKGTKLHRQSPNKKSLFRGKQQRKDQLIQKSWLDRAKTRIKAWTGLIAYTGQDEVAQGQGHHRLYVHTPEVGGNRWGQSGQDTQSDRG